MVKEKIESIITDLISRLEISPLKIETSKDDGGSYLVQIDLAEQDTGILIGYHGDTIAALQLILGLLLHKKTGEWNRTIVNIGDYRQKRAESLKNTADDAVSRVLSSGEPIALFNLNPFERRVVHLHLESQPEVVSQSDGEGKNRHLVISLKDPSLSQTPLPEEDGISTDQDVNSQS